MAWSYIRLGVNLLALLFQMWIYQYLISIENQPNCPCNSGWKLTQGKMISSLMFVICLANLFYPINNLVMNVPVIGSGAIAVFIFLMGLEFFVVNRISKQVISYKCREKCTVEGHKTINGIFAEMTMLSSIFWAFILSIILFYF